jgi:DNA-binding phage protein
VKSFQFEPDNRRQTYLALASQIEGQLRDAYARRYEAKGETQSSLAAKLGVDRSAIHRRLTGRTNMTIETIADMVWALGHCIKVEIFDPETTSTNHRHLRPVEPTLQVQPTSREIHRCVQEGQKTIPAHSSEPWVKIDKLNKRENATSACKAPKNLQQRGNLPYSN